MNNHRDNDLTHEELTTPTHCSSELTTSTHDHPSSPWIDFRETLNFQACDAIHIEMETSTECDTFIPSIDTTSYHPWYSSFPLVENNIRYSFVTYVRVKSTAAEDGTRDNSCKSDSDMFEIQNFFFLPQMILDRHEQYIYLKLVQDILSSGNLKNDGTGTGKISKFGCQMRFDLRKTSPLLTTKEREK